LPHAWFWRWPRVVVEGALLETYLDSNEQ